MERLLGPWHFDQGERRDLLNTISALEAVASCTPAERDLICRLSTLTDIAASIDVCRQGEPGLNFYVIVGGEAMVTIDGRSVATLGPGCGFGEIALLTPHGRRIATVTTVRPSRLIVVSRPEFATLMIEIPTFVTWVLAACRDRLAADDVVVTS
jgi:CRP-like cAMP-binding protein